MMLLLVFQILCVVGVVSGVVSDGIDNVNNKIYYSYDWIDNVYDWMDNIYDMLDNV